MVSMMMSRDSELCQPSCLALKHFPWKNRHSNTPHKIHLNLQADWRIWFTNYRLSIHPVDGLSAKMNWMGWIIKMISRFSFNHIYIEWLKIHFIMSFKFRFRHTNEFYGCMCIVYVTFISRLISIPVFSLKLLVFVVNS